MLDIEIKGDSELNSIARSITGATEAGVRAGGEILRDEVAALAPVRSGNLRDGIKGGLRVSPTNDGAEAVLSSGVIYDERVNERSQHYERGQANAEARIAAAIEADVQNVLNA